MLIAWLVPRQANKYGT